MSQIYWAVERQNQGQIVEEHYPQVAGAAEGYEGDAKGLRLVIDRSDRSWAVYADAKMNHEIASGNMRSNVPPTVEESIAIRRRARHEN